MPWVLRGPLLPGRMLALAGTNALAGNIIAIAIAFWARLSVETYPGIRRSYVILPSALTGHGVEEETDTDEESVETAAAEEGVRA